jgi:hypothetical protein
MRDIIMTDVISPLPLGFGGTPKNAQYHQYICVECKTTARNTYVEPVGAQMLERRLCYMCNYWVDFAAKNKAEGMTIIGGTTYTPGNRTTGSMRGMSGRRFDIEYIPPSIHAGKRITTFDLWCGSTIPEHLLAKFPDTAKFLANAGAENVGGTRCWNPSNSKAEPYPLPRDIGLK